jgi:DNA gyrase subunit A
MDKKDNNKIDDPVENLDEVPVSPEEIAEEAKPEVPRTLDVIGETKKGIKTVSIVEEMKKSYLDYSMSVIVSRALPDVRDGLKPVQRRIIYTMYKTRNLPDRPYRKSARTVGEVMGKYHPHGDSSIYEAMVRMAQEFSTRYELVDGQGNFGSIDGDSAAAMRYTEARMSKIAMELVRGMSKDTVEYSPTYDGTTIEPNVLPTRIPNLLLNGGDGIAVGMATKIPPHNLGELLDALQAIVAAGNKADDPKGQPGELSAEEVANQKKGVFTPRRWQKYPDFETELTAEDLIEYVKGPDFPTGGAIYGQRDIIEMYATGRGRVVARAIADIEETKGGKFQIIISEIPFQVNKARLVAKIGELVRDKKLQGISDLRDESNKDGIRIVVEVGRTGKPKVILNKLFKYTEMQKAFNANILALVNGEPKTLTLKKILELFIEHRQQVVIRRTEFDLADARNRAHILEGLKKALDHLDEVIKTIRESKTQEAAKDNLIKKFDFSEVQSQAILDMQLRRLAALERQKIEDEYTEILKTIKGFEGLLDSPAEILKVITDELKEIGEKYSDARRTKVFKNKIGEMSEEDLVVAENVIVTLSHEGYIKRMKTDVYKKQKRGGKGVLGAKTKEEDYIEHVLECNTHDTLLFFTSKGRLFEVKVHEVPEFSRQAKGIPAINLVQIDPGELITTVLKKGKDTGVMHTDEIQEDQDAKEVVKPADFKYFTMFTRHGLVKKTEISAFDKIRLSGIIAIKLDQGDELSWVRPTTGEDEVIVVTKMGKAIRFHEKDVRQTGRATRGVTAIRFKQKDDEVIGADVVRENEDRIFTVSENGIGKMTKLKEYPTQNRGGQGVFTARVTDKTGTVVIMRILDHPDKEIVLISMKGNVIRLGMNDVPTLKRQTSGVKVMRLNADDSVAAMAVLDKEEASGLDTTPTEDGGEGEEEE